MADATSLRDALLRQPRVLVVGGGFIGTEVAAAARARGCEVTLVHLEPTVLHGRLDRELADLMQAMHHSHGVRLIANEAVKEIRGHDKVEEVELASGRILEADLVVVGVGAYPNDGWLAGSGLVVGDGVHVDEYCAAVPGGEVVACGDVARFHSPVYGRSLRVEHWTNAREQAELAARTLLAGERRTEAYLHIPYFWSQQYGVRLQQMGLFKGDRDVVAAFASDGGVPRRLSLYADDSGTVTGGTSVNAPELLNQVRSFIERHVPMQEAAAQVAEAF
jgi:NADPH-dependent 2,4-dienoyl-CoA reductase/sulfur reductase-like enzyme